MIELVLRDFSLINLLKDEFKNDKNFIKDCLYNGIDLINIPKEFYNKDKEIVLYYFQHIDLLSRGNFLNYCDKEFIYDHENLLYYYNNMKDKVFKLVNFFNDYDKLYFKKMKIYKNVNKYNEFKNIIWRILPNFISSNKIKWIYFDFDICINYNLNKKIF